MQATNFENQQPLKISAHILTHVVTSDVCHIDIDNTLLIAKEQLGSAAWGDHLIEDLKRKGVHKKSRRY